MSLYLIYRSYRPGEASTNRALSYFKALSYFNVPANVVYLIPNKNREKVEDHINGINFIYCWDRFYINNRLLKMFSYCTYIIQLMNRFKGGDKVYIYDNAELLHWFSKKKGVEIYYEVTEHPSFNPPSSRIVHISWEKYYRLCKQVAGLFVISRALKDFYQEKGVDGNKIEVLNVTVDEERFVGLEKDKSQKYIAYCGTVLNDKDGVDLLIKAFAMFHEHHPEYKLKIIGKTPPAYYKDSSSNNELIKSLGLENDVILTGQIHPEEMPQMLKDADALVLARPDNLQAKYGFPTKLGEYLLTENPVVVTAVGDIPIFLTDNESAYIAKPGDVVGICEILCKIVDNPEVAAEVGRKGASVARTSFNNITEVRKMLTFMQIAIKNESYHL